MNGKIINITRFCTDDGPGIRTTVFLKGCPLSCIWCHNPESQNPNSELMYDAAKCVNCAMCGDACNVGCHSFDGNHKFDRKNCVVCGKCAAKCPSGALQVSGKVISADEVFNEIKKDMVYYKASQGGVTVSGGEPLYQPNFTSEILKMCKEAGIHTAIETSGFASKGDLQKVIEYCDLVLFDIKETDARIHKKYTGVPLDRILKNLDTINSMKIPFIIRLPIIPDRNDRPEHFERVREIVTNLKFCIGIEIMPYHILGRYKYKLLQRPYFCENTAEPDNDIKEKWSKLLNKEYHL